MEADEKTVALALQLGVSLGFVILMTLVHGLGLVGIQRMLRLDGDRLKERDFDVRSVVLMCGMALLLFALHIVEIWIFAIFYLIVGAIQTLEEALYYSAAAYATLGRTADYFPGEWRLIGAVEALIGFLLIGWSTAFIVAKTNKLRS